MTILILSLLFVVALASAAFCAGAETGFMSVSRGRILHMAREGGARAKLIQQAITDMGRTVTTLLVGNNFAAVTYSSVSAALAAACFPDSPGAQAAWSVGAAFLMLYAGEFLPKLLCSARPVRRMLQLAFGWDILRRMLAPLVATLDFVIAKFLPRRETRIKITPDAVLKILADRKDGVKVSDLESALIGRLMVLRSKGMFVTPETLLSALDENV